MAFQHLESRVTFERPLPPIPLESSIQRKPFMSIYAQFIELAGLDKNVNPQNGTVVCSVASFLFFILLCGLAVCFPRPAMRIVVPVVGGALFVALSMKLLADLRMKRTHNYARNLGNTVIVALLSLVALMVLYEFRWYHQLNTTVIQVGQDVIVQPRFPAMAVIAAKGIEQQGVLSPEPLKCFVGIFDEESPYCHTLSATQFQQTNSCNCNDSWIPGIKDKQADTNSSGFVWGSRYVSFRPPELLFSRGDHDYMTLQVFYNYNRSADSSKLGPQLWLLVYDPSLSLEEATLRHKSPPMSLYDANADTHVNMALIYNRYLDGSGYYKYGLQFSSIPNRNVVCDVSHGSKDLCHTSIRIQIPRTERTIYQQKKSMNWSDVVAEAGSYFALVQFLAWMISGQIWAAV